MRTQLRFLAAAGAIILVAIVLVVILGLSGGITGFVGAEAQQNALVLSKDVVRGSSSETVVLNAWLRNDGEDTDESLVIRCDALIPSQSLWSGPLPEGERIQIPITLRLPAIYEDTTATCVVETPSGLADTFTIEAEP